MNHNRKVITFLLGAIFVIALVLRLYKLSEFPVGFHIDEAILGYTGYSIMHTGKDTNNHFLPLYTEVFGDNIPTGYHYLTIPAILLFGLSEFATRLPAVFFGSLTVIAMFFLTNACTKNKGISLLAAFLLAVSPWHIILSRGSSEAILSLFLVVTGFAGVFLAIEKKSIPFLAVGTFFLILSFFSYHTPRAFVPLLLFVTLLMFTPPIRIRATKFRNTFYALFLAVGLIAFFLLVILPGGKDRFNQVSIFGFPETRLVLEEQQREDGVNNMPGLISRTYHNKIINYSLTFLGQYFSHFSFDYLFLKGGLPIMFQIPNIGLLHLIELPFLLYGIIFSITKKNQINKILLLWLLLGPVVSALTTDDIPNVRRSLFILVPLEIFVAIGFIQLAIRTQKYRNIYVFVISVIFLYNISYFLHQYFVHAKVHRTWYRSNGFKTMMEYVKKEYDSYDKVIFGKGGGGVYPLVLFYTQYNPQTYQQEGSPKDTEYTGFGKFFFVPQACPSTDGDDRFPKNTRAIYINKGECKVPLYKRFTDVYREDGTKAYRIVYD